ncbi:MAG: glycosyltransferase [Candidatus Omnitrophica bacterium]|nr:glycosyltransferase [Candidatus Omnitrophota bacterium]
MLSIIVPAHNEQENIQPVLERIESSLDIPFEVVVVNDHSEDDTGKIVQSLTNKYKNIRLVENKLPAGFANAIRTGFINASGEFVIPIMADLCDDLETVKEMYGKMPAGFDVVCGSRYIKGGARLGGSKLKGFFSSFVGWSLFYLLGIPTHDVANAFKMYRKKVIESINIESVGFEISMELPLKAHFLGFKITEVPTVWKEREKGKSSFKMFKLFPNYLKFYTWALVKRVKG